MGATAVVQYGLHQLLGKNSPVGRATDAVKKYVAPPAIPAPPALPPPPSNQQLVQDQAKAMTLAARRVQMMQGAGYGSTIKTSPLGAPPAQTQRKQLLGS